MIKFLEVKRAYYADPENVAVQFRVDSDKWYDCATDVEPAFDAQDYRIRPRTIRIGEIDVPEPEREPPQKGVEYFCPFQTRSPMVGASYWEGDNNDSVLLARGLIHLTKEAAIAHAKALILVSGGKIDE